MVRPRFDKAASPVLANGLALARAGVEKVRGTDPLRAGGAGAVRDRAAARRPTNPFASVSVYQTMAEAAEAWSDLQAVAAFSPYQQWAWMLAWMETEGQAAGVMPFIVVARDTVGQPIALLPLGMRQAGPLRRAMFLGGRPTNYNMGLFHPAVRWTADDAEALLRRAARSSRIRIDLCMLVNQPVTWSCFDNPLAALRRRQPSPSFSHRAQLEADGEAFLVRHQSAAARKKLRSKAKNLAAIGPVVHRTAGTEAEIAAVLDAHLAQKAAKLATLGIVGPDRALLRTLFDRACLPRGDSPAPVELHALYCGEAIVATFGGLSHAGRFSGLLISYDLEPAYARCSPGELLLTAVIRQKCAEGYEGLDLGIGEARYKDSYCDIADPLVDSFLPLTLRGHLATTIDASKLRLKSAIKQSPRAWAMVLATRKALGTRARRDTRE